MTMDHLKLHDLIALVQGYPSLYDTAHPGYKRTKKNGVIGPLLLNSFQSKVTLIHLFEKAALKRSVFWAIVRKDTDEFPYGFPQCVKER